MKHFASPTFWERHRGLPSGVRERADRAYALLKENPQHPSLHFKKVGRFRSARVGLHHRALSIDVDDGLLWFWIGTHAEYDRLVK